ncbi:MAG: YraN family protein [Phycisphaerales bacterium]|nr:YraN family protein [Phycisphaerales bacterium]
MGIRGEHEAAKHLRASGCRVLRRNVRFRFGEIDLIALDGGTVVFVEVKTRAARDGRGPRPEESVGVRKARKLAALADAACRRYGWEDRPKRIDVVAVDWPTRGRPVVRRHIGAVRV